MTSHIAKVIMEDFDKERAKTDFVYFATHCLIDATTGKQIQWTPAQIEQLQKLAELNGRQRTIIERPLCKVALWG